MDIVYGNDTIANVEMNLPSVISTLGHNPVNGGDGFTYPVSIAFWEFDCPASLFLACIQHLHRPSESVGLKAFQDSAS